MKATVCVTLKDSIHDPQGKAILHALSALGFDGVKGVRAGKYFELDLSCESAETGETLLKEMCEKLLANTVIEKYHYEIHKGVS